MEIWTADHLRQKAGQHIASEPHLRIEIQEVTSSMRLDTLYHGELLVLILHGSVNVRTEKGLQKVSPGDQILLSDGESFELILRDEHSSVTVQMIWTPGLNPCEVCWEHNNRFFSEQSS
jgi:homogentisate 1,2-dioxygenase